MATNQFQLVIDNCIQALLHWRRVDKRNLVKDKTPEERTDAAKAEYFAKRRLRNAADDYLKLVGKGEES